MGRCTSTRYAVTAYFCGEVVANNLNREEASNTSHPLYEGLDDFEEALVLLHASGKEVGRHERLVYRLGVSSESFDHDLPMDHVWSIVSQPDGTFMWLQSYVNHYSLAEWMQQSDHRDQRYLSLRTLQGLLQQLRGLMAISKWTPAANAAYLALFNVDILKHKPDVASEWKPKHRLTYFIWDISCEYPLPEGRGSMIQTKQKKYKKDSRKRKAKP